jgi:hypothetical protein
MASTTETFLKSRVSEPALNKWSSGFSNVKKFAEEKKVPLVAVWSNGDKCGNCINFEKSLMEADFTSWMEKSGCAFWFGCSSDKNAEDKYNGTGFKFVKAGKLINYPFVRVYWKGGNVDVAESGKYWSGGTATGGAKIVEKLKELLKNFNQEKPEVHENSGCDSCCDGESCCDGKVPVRNALLSMKEKLLIYQAEFGAAASLMEETSTRISGLLEEVYNKLRNFEYDTMTDISKIDKQLGENGDGQ